MKKWTIEELFMFRDETANHVQDLKESIKWYNSRGVKKMKREVIDSLTKELIKVNEEIMERYKLAD